ncbi:hypothetical protein A2U01_0031356, partial [Trifolium medium]|nr:hypothetical protein [Trifolium medium]
MVPLQLILIRDPQRSELPLWLFSSKFANCIVVGIEPDKLLYETLNIAKELSGIVPDNRLCERFNAIMSLSSPISGGMLPLKLLLDKSKL